MNRTRYWIAIMATAVVAAGVARAQDIIRFEDGYLTFVNEDPALYYRIEFKPNLTGPEDWDGSFHGLRNIQSPDPEVTVPVGVFYRVAGRDTPWVGGTASSSTILAGHTAYVGDEEVTGTMSNIGQQNVTPGTAAQTITEGYHDGTGRVAGDADLAPANIKAGVTIFEVEGEVIEATGDATLEQVLAGSTFSRTGEANLTGAMPNIGQQNVTPGTAAQTITEGYHDGMGQVAGDADLVAGNIRKDVDIFGVTGTYEGESGHADVQQTGQTESYRTGDDGYHRRGVAWPDPRFTDNEDETVTDNLTGLVWVKAPHDLGGNAGSQTWNNAIDFCNGLTFAGHSDWRLPNRFELESLLDLQRFSPALPSGHPFTGVQVDNYWSSSTYAADTAAAWFVVLDDGYVDGGVKTLTHLVWPVRGGHALPAPSGTVLIPGGTISGTNLLSVEDGEVYSDWYPATYSLTVDAFYMDRYEVTKAKWDEVYAWAIAHGYTFEDRGDGEPPGRGKAANHPVQTVTWYDVVKWCNARSEMEGRPAVYTVNGAVYKTGEHDNVVQTSAAGYRLPTDVEWEYAARGGVSSRRFPWADSDTIQHARANYYSSSSRSYDTSPTREYHPTYHDGTTLYTSPVGSFAANGYGLYDMAGNVWEWCFTAAGSHRVHRGGSFYNYAHACRVARSNTSHPGTAIISIGFRAVLPPGPADAP